MNTANRHDPGKASEKPQDHPKNAKPTLSELEWILAAPEGYFGPVQMMQDGQVRATLGQKLLELIPVTSDTLPCGHHRSLLVESVESDYKFCDLCECRRMRNDAEKMEGALRQIPDIILGSTWKTPELRESAAHLAEIIIREGVTHTSQPQSQAKDDTGSHVSHTDEKRRAWDQIVTAAKDAARYRHMRSSAAFQDRNGPGLYWYLPRLNRDLPLGERLDAAIDEAMSSTPTD